MTKRILLILLAFSLFAASSRPVAATSEPTVQEIISKLLDARGGAEKVRAVTSLKQTGKVITQDGGEYGLTAFLKAPNRLRYDVTLPMVVRVFAFDGQHGWKKILPGYIRPGAPVRPEDVQNATPAENMSKGETRDIRDEADFNRFNPGFNLDSAAPGNIQLLPTRNFEGIPCHVLKLPGSDNSDRYYFIEVPTGLLVKIGEKADPESNGTLLSDYREMNGVKFPFNIEIQNKGRTVQQTLVETIEVNPGFSDEIFARPKEQSKKS